MSESPGGLLAVEDLRVEIPTPRGVVHAVRGVSFDVRAGETFALVGESGSGKTMTCRAIVRLVHPPGRITSGRVVFEGRDLVPLPERELERVRGRGMVMVFQDPMTALNPVLSVERQLTEVLPDGGARRARAVALLQQVGIGLVGLGVVEDDLLGAGQGGGDASTQDRPSVLVADHGEAGAQLEAGDQLGLGAI